MKDEEKRVACSVGCWVTLSVICEELIEITKFITNYATRST